MRFIKKFPEYQEAEWPGFFSESTFILPLIIFVHHVPLIESVLQGQVCITYSTVGEVSVWLEVREERSGVPVRRLVPENQNVRPYL